MRTTSARVLGPLGLFAAAAFAASCSSSSASGTLQVLLGGEADALTRAPAPTTLAVDALEADGSTTSLLRAPIGQTTYDLADLGTEREAILRVTAVDDGGNVLLRGTTLPIRMGGLAGQTLPVFIQRTGELARIPSPPDDARPAPLLGVAGGRYVVVVGGADPALAPQIRLYDLLKWTKTASYPPIPRTPKSMAVVGLTIVAIDETGATAVDLSSNSTYEVTAPAGGTYADVAGGATVTADDGTVYVVGATRTGTPTAKVLRIGLDNTLSMASLVTPRAGASATWVAGRGLVVAGGSATGSGAEVLPPLGSVARPIPFPADPTTGAGIAALDDHRVLLIGGIDGTAPATARTLDTACTASCTAGVFSPDLPAPLTTAQAFQGGTGTFVVGDGDGGTTHAYWIAAGAIREVVVKDARHLARAVVAPTGDVLVAGGAPTIESFAP